MMDNEYVVQLVYFLLNFGIILSTLMFYSILAWVITSWLILFGAMNQGNRVFQFLTQLVTPILKPFQWARIGMIDLSPVVAILLLDLVMRAMSDALTQVL